MFSDVDSQREGGGGWVGGERLNKELVCKYAEPKDTDNTVVEAWTERTG